MWMLCSGLSKPHPTGAVLSFCADRDMDPGTEIIAIGSDHRTVHGHLKGYDGSWLDISNPLYLPFAVRVSTFGSSQMDLVHFLRGLEDPRHPREEGTKGYNANETWQAYRVNMD